MLSCPVLRCMNFGAAFVVGRGLRGGYCEAYVCADHKALIDAGSPWYMEGRLVLIGEEIPPVLEGSSVRPSMGADGFTLILDVAGQPKPFEVLLTPREARMLAVNMHTASDDRPLAINDSPILWSN